MEQAPERGATECERRCTADGRSANPITYTVVVGWTDRRTERTYSSTGSSEAFSYTATVTVFNDPAS
jgi:hypothetical protein